MAGDGPTTVGSIVGKLKMDRAQWVADVAATKQEVRELEGLDPDIHIDDNAGAVITRMKAAKAAVDDVESSSEKLTVTQGRLSAALKDGDLAAARVNLAQMRLNELREKGITSGSRHAAAELALAAAQRAAAEATDDTADATIRANEANRTSVTRVGAIVTAIALLVPLLAPVGAAAVGVGGAFLGMGAAGVLAIVGIHREMKQGTALGNEYRAGIDDLKGSMNTLAQTSAVAMLSSFQRVVRETRAALPDLNTQVGHMSNLLGRSGGNLFSGAINALRVLNPLFLTAGVYLEQLTAGFERWTENGGLEEFGGYALSMLPQVTELLGQLASMVMHILQALSPLGVVGMAVLGGIADVINAIPVDVLSHLIVTLTWGAVAFKAWGFIAPMLAGIAQAMGLVGAATTIATGPIGWVVAGLSALAGIFAVVIANNSGATQAMQDYTYAVQEDTGAIGDNIRAKAAQKLLDSGIIAAAKELKVSTEDVVNATLGHADAQRRLNEQLGLGEAGSKRTRDELDRTGLAIDDYTVAYLTLKQGIEANQGAIEGEISRYRDLQAALGQTTTATRGQQQASEAVASALGISTGAVEAAKAGQDDMKASTENATAQMWLQNDAAGLLREALDLLGGKQLTAAEAENRFESQLVRTTEAMKTNGTELDGLSEGAIANRGSLLDLIKASQESAIAFRDQGGSAEETRQKMLAGRDAIIEQMVANGMNRDAVTRYVNELYKIPASIPPTKVETDTAEAEYKLNLLARGRTAVIRAVVEGAAGTGRGVDRAVAMGGTIRGLAGGGSVVGGGTLVGPGTAGSDTAGVFRGGHGEEVISNVFGQADRNRALLKAINAGYTPAQSTAGTVNATPSTITAPAQPQATVVQVDVHVSVLKNEDPGVVGNQVGRGIKNALVGVKLA